MFELPTQTDSTANNQTDSDSNDETTFGGERIEEYEDYWKAISMVRLLKKSCKALGVAKVKDSGKSPWADHYGHFAAIAYGTDDEPGLKETCQDLPGNLPEYKDEFETPEGDFDVITAETAEDFGLPADDFGDDEDPIFVPVEYEAPEEVWYEVSADETTVTEVLEGISGIGEARAAEAYKALKEAGLLKDDDN
ncbi:MULTISPECIES: hypothetical protein [unclassified Halorubrum]|uniref:hypothetical protein n=1 Tax=unclassified Halorubrum TaxID=2642239 RepID=UPI00190BC7D5|nr:MULTISPECIES: hypothetical protein [unclassified Halorubrum]